MRSNAGMHAISTQAMPVRDTPELLQPLGPDDLEALIDFEFKNRAFFESRINARPPEFYSRDGVAKAIDAALADARADRAYQFLLRDGTGALVARINLHGVRRQHFHSAEVGYRVAEAANGRGHASRALGLLLPIAYDSLGLQRLEAKVHAGNPASTRVLLRHGFSQYGLARRSFELGGVWYDKLCFERHATPL